MDNNKVTIDNNYCMSKIQIKIFEKTKQKQLTTTKLPLETVKLQLTTELVQFATEKFQWQQNWYS